MKKRLKARFGTGCRVSAGDVCRVCTVSDTANHRIRLFYIRGCTECFFIVLDLDMMDISSWFWVVIDLTYQLHIQRSQDIATVLVVKIHVLSTYAGALSNTDRDINERKL